MTLEVRTGKSNFLDASIFLQRAESELRRWGQEKYEMDEPTSTVDGYVATPITETPLRLKHLPFYTFFSYTDQKVQKQLQMTASTTKLDLQIVWPVDTGRSKYGWSIVAAKYVMQVENKTVNPEDNFGYTPLLWDGWSRQMPRGVAQDIFNTHVNELVHNLKNKV